MSDFWWKIQRSLPHEASMKIISISKKAWNRINPGGEMLLDDHSGSPTNLGIDAAMLCIASAMLKENNETR